MGPNHQNLPPLGETAMQARPAGGGHASGTCGSQGLGVSLHTHTHHSFIPERKRGGLEYLAGVTLARSSKVNDIRRLQTRCA